jgi:hypothetical protein
MRTPRPAPVIGCGPCAASLSSRRGTGGPVVRLGTQSAEGGTARGGTDRGGCQRLCPEGPGGRSGPNSPGGPCNPALIITLIGELLLSFTLTAFGVTMAARIKQFQAYMALTQMLVMPLFFRGALPAERPARLADHADPDRSAHLHRGSHAPRRLQLPGHQPGRAARARAGGVLGWLGGSLGLSLGIVALRGIAMAAVAILEFSKTE